MKRPNRNSIQMVAACALMSAGLAIVGPIAPQPTGKPVGSKASTSDPTELVATR